MVFVISVILAIIVILTIGLILRKRIYDKVDHQEKWKMDIMARDVAQQISKIKSLNLSGETQEKFELWKGRWEHIITKELPDIEDHLFDAEDAADKFRMKRANNILTEGDQKLQNIEVKIEEILEELDELLSSEKTSREEVAQIVPTIKLLRKTLSQSRYQYGKAEKFFDKKLDEFDTQLATYEDNVESGDYLEANRLIQVLKEEIAEFEIKMEQFPEILRRCKQDLPSQLEQVLAGLQEMKNDGYRVKHFGFDKEIITYQDQLKNLQQQIEQGDITDVSTKLDEIEERITEMYESLEGEAIAKNYLEQRIPEYEKSISEIAATYDDTKLEVEELQKAYFVENNDMERFFTIGKTISTLREQLKELHKEMDDDQKSHSDLQNIVEDGFDKIEQLEEQHEEFKKSIENLRKDEMEAREKLIEMRRQLYELNRKIKKSNIPGVPGFIWTRFETASAKNSQVVDVLEDYPLDIAKVQHALSEAKQAVDQTHEQIDIMLDQAYLTEQVIQYANRYRSQQPDLNGKLKEAERLFRNYEYELSLEHAAKAIEEIEPGALKRIEENQLTLNR
ncbi:septation ring formation regulator [Oceanobacillus iheyensis HTE831]|uniref:Septation ring formation regulator EzrA n=1 Tax=Oceanobacillus iheyensis (strain DSM 14371 / CIP 107618 / JCM 11309 / KCTC 3954 / HTE831) TaxID=221109 RepID=EZRA_OCEIH|nr:septation ring formation regulator EzrA [Oceanobacillus iheyensis]Q8EPB2.1 RecName: Full=Septation ring formation regulator EzrA [Oceanobacillus iheyensis HTE831]BAC14156.1 septation ring formation regulator [Oceanobacillus iheyensis HTE831]